MKPGCFYILLIPFIAVLILSTTGCPVAVGKCTYGDTPDVHGAVIIKSIEKVYSGKQLNYRVHVKGFFERDFIYSEEDFREKFTSKGYRTGTELDGVITSGGPCPPMYKI